MSEELPPLTEWARNTLEKSFQKFPGRQLHIPEHHIAEVEDLVSRGLVQKAAKTSKGKTITLYFGTPQADAPPNLDLPITPDPK